jgi:hypothetical protein
MLSCSRCLEVSAEVYMWRTFSLYGAGLFWPPCLLQVYSFCIKFHSMFCCPFFVRRGTTGTIGVYLVCNWQCGIFCHLYLLWRNCTYFFASNMYRMEKLLRYPSTENEALCLGDRLSDRSGGWSGWGCFLVNGLSKGRKRSYSWI